MSPSLPPGESSPVVRGHFTLVRHPLASQNCPEWSVFSVGPSTRSDGASARWYWIPEHSWRFVHADSPMMDSMTHPSTTLAWPGFRPDGGLLLPLPEDQFLTGLPPSLTWQGPTLECKDECHVTVLNRICGNAAREALGDARVRRLFEDQEWILHRTGNARLLRKPGKPDAFSLIEDVHLPSLNRFRQALSLAMRADLPPAPPHVTLYTARKPEGIGVPDQATLARLEVAHFRLPCIANRRPPALSEALRQAYRTTHYSVDTGRALAIGIGEHSPAADELLDSHHAGRALLLSACNPFSEASSDTANEL